MDIRDDDMFCGDDKVYVAHDALLKFNLISGLNSVACKLYVQQYVCGVDECNVNIKMTSMISKRYNKIAILGKKMIF